MSPPIITLTIVMVLHFGLVVKASGSYWETGGNNVCYLEQADCKYRVTLLPVACNHANDQPSSQRQRPATNSELYKRSSSAAVAEKNQIITSSHYVTDIKPEVDAATESLKKLDILEQKLIRLVEDLSVKSLRHIREIRSEIRHVSKSVDEIREGSGSGGSGKRFRGRRRSLPGGECPPEFVRVGTWPSCYRFSNFEATWHNAKEYCSAFGANLVSLESMKEAYVIDYLLKSNAAYEEAKGWWTSGQYIVRNQRWVWVKQHRLGLSNDSVEDRTQTKPIEFSRWASGEPNARSTMHCMILYKDEKYFWHDAACSDRHSFICEIDD